MKLRRQASDFCVHEKNSLPVTESGAFAVYELLKTHWATLDAIEHFSRTLKIPRHQITHAGLKDRHAVTSQLITIRNGPRRSFLEENLELRYLGQSTRATGPNDILGNHFEIVVRSLSDHEAQHAEQAVHQLQNAGVVNYFDDQRFGSWMPGFGFIAEAWLREDYELALRLVFAEPHPDDSSSEKIQKAILREHWGDWLTCKALLDRSHRRSIVTYLCDHPQGFKIAWSHVNEEWRGLYLSALQSDLWNHIVSLIIEQQTRPDQRSAMTLKSGPVWLPHSLSAEQREFLSQLNVPLPSSRLKSVPVDLQSVYETALEKKGWPLRSLKVKFPRDRFFSRSSRPVLIMPEGLSGRIDEDEFDPGRNKITLQFTLPRGAYATLVIKRLMPATEEVYGLEPTDEALPESSLTPPDQ